MDKKLQEIRKKLDHVDRNIVQALADRQELVKEISDLKLDRDRDIRDPMREDSVLDRISELARKAGVDRHFAEELFREIISHSVRYQTHSVLDHQNLEGDSRRVRIAFQGTEGAYSELAGQRHFGDRYETVSHYGYDTFRQAAEAVEKGDADYAMLPVENTTAGSINETYDILGDGTLHIVGEEVLRIVHCLLAIEKVPLERIRRILSHPQAIAQCSRFLAGLHRGRVESYLDTAMAAKKIVEDGDLSQAAIAGRQAAELYDLEILEEDIANQPENYTRFVVVGPEPVTVDLQIPCKTSLLLVTPHKEGALIDCLRVLGDHGINMTKLESRPRAREPWKYQFYLDIEGNVEDAEVDNALAELESQSASLKILGCYPADREWHNEG